MTYPAPQPFQALPAEPPQKRGWPGSAKITAAVLVATTLGAAGAGVALSSSAKSDTDSVQKQLSKSKDDLDNAEADAKKTKADADAADEALAKAKDELSTSKADLAGAQSDRDAAQTSADALRALFPLDFLDFAGSQVAGAYSLSITPGSAECTGYADNDSACAPESLPNTLTMSGDATGGYSVASNFFSDITLQVDAGSFTGSGVVDDNVADLCDGVTVPTAFTITIIVSELGLDAADQLDPTSLFVTFTMGAQASAGCTATSRSVSLSGIPA